MLKRFGAEKVRQILSETEYKISLEQFKSELGNIKDLS